MLTGKFNHFTREINTVEKGNKVKLKSVKVHPKIADEKSAEQKASAPKANAKEDTTNNGSNEEDITKKMVSTENISSTPKEEEKGVDRDEKKRSNMDEVWELCTNMLLETVKGKGDVPKGCTIDPEAVASEAEEETSNKFNQGISAELNIKQVRSRDFNFGAASKPKIRGKPLLGVFCPMEHEHFNSEQMSTTDIVPVHELNKSTCSMKS